MALRYAAANGNWSNVSTWDGGASIPGNGDTVYANNKTVTIDQNITIGGANNFSVSAGAFIVGCRYKITAVGTTNFVAIGAPSNTVGEAFTATGVGTGTGTADTVASISTAAQGAAAAGGKFDYTANYTMQVGVINGTTNTLVVSGGGVVLNLVGEVGYAVASTNGIYAIEYKSSGAHTITGDVKGGLLLTDAGCAGSTLTITGNVSSKNSSSTSNYTMQVTQPCTITVNGDVRSTAAGNSQAVINTSTSSLINVIINGDVYGQSAAYSGASTTLGLASTANTLVINGNVVGSSKSSSYVIYQTNGNGCEISGNVTGTTDATQTTAQIRLEGTPTGRFWIGGNVVANKSALIEIPAASTNSEFTIGGTITGSTTDTVTCVAINGLPSSATFSIGELLPSAKAIEFGTSFAKSITLTQTTFKGNQVYIASSDAPMMTIKVPTSTTITLVGTLEGGINTRYSGAVRFQGGQLIINGNVVQGPMGGASKSSEGLSIQGSMVGSSVVINGNVGNVSNLGEWYALEHMGYLGSVTINGDVAGGGGINAPGVYNNTESDTTGTFVINGSVTGGAGSLSPGLQVASYGCRAIVITGAVTGGTSADNQAPGILYTVASGYHHTITTGDLVATSTNSAVLNTSASTNLSLTTLISNKNETDNVNGISAVCGFLKKRLGSAPSSTKYRTQSLNGVDTTYTSYSNEYWDASSAVIDPADVRSGSTYGPGLIYTGTLIVPDPSNVAAGVPTDDTVGTSTGGGATAEETALAVRAELTAELERISNCATVDSVGAQLAATL